MENPLEERFEAMADDLRKAERLLTELTKDLQTAKQDIIVLKRRSYAEAIWAFSILARSSIHNTGHAPFLPHGAFLNSDACREGINGQMGHVMHQLQRVVNEDDMKALRSEALARVNQVLERYGFPDISLTFIEW